MTKLVALLIVLAIGIQLIRPLGLPGLRKRADVWKLALGGLAMFAVVAMTKGA
jgi:hypothetical protein